MHNFAIRTLPAGALTFLLAACASTPSGPSQMALPGTGKSFEQFRADDGGCRQYAQTQAADSPDSAGARSGVKSAAIGTGVGALAGVAIGNSGRAAATGAGVGLVFGAASGAGATGRSAGAAQNRYDTAYAQCMYGHGHKVAVSAMNGYATQGEAVTYASPPPPPPASPPPPSAPSAYPTAPYAAPPVAAPGTILPPAGAEQSYSR